MKWRFHIYTLYTLYAIGIAFISNRISNTKLIYFFYIKPIVHGYQYERMNASTLLVELIREQTEKEEKQDIWKESPYKDLAHLQSNNAGIVGEKLCQRFCDLAGIEAEVDGTKTKKIGGGTGDGVIKGKVVEIKLAHQGSTSANFQHELGEVPWIADFMVFIDVSPQCLYFTIFRNFSEEHYKSGAKCDAIFPTKQVTWRKGKGAFKLDTSVKINDDNAAKGLAIKITEETPFEAIRAYIDSVIS